MHQPSAALPICVMSSCNYKQQRGEAQFQGPAGLPRQILSVKWTQRWRTCLLQLQVKALPKLSRLNLVLHLCHLAQVSNQHRRARGHHARSCGMPSTAGRVAGSPSGTRGCKSLIQQLPNRRLHPFPVASTLPLWSSNSAKAHPLSSYQAQLAAPPCVMREHPV